MLLLPKKRAQLNLELNSDKKSEAFRTKQVHKTGQLVCLPQRIH